MAMFCMIRMAVCELAQAVDAAPIVFMPADIWWTCTEHASQSAAVELYTLVVCSPGGEATGNCTSSYALSLQL
jgi:hypothetical protein